MVDGDEWVIDGLQVVLERGRRLDFGIVFAITDPDADTYKRGTMILVPTDTPGLEVVRPISVMGHEGRAWNTHCEVRYTGVRVPVANTLGERGDAFRIAQKRLGPGRIHHVMRWLGQMQRAFDLMCSYALEREAFGGPLADKQTVQNWIADSAAGIQACRLLTMDTARKIDEGSEARVEVSLLKFYAAGVLNDVIDRADPGARRPRAHRRDAARADGDARAWRADLRRPRRGAPHGRRPPDPQELRRRRPVAVRLKRCWQTESAHALLPPRDELDLDARSERERSDGDGRPRGERLLELARVDRRSSPRSRSIDVR